MLSIYTMLYMLIIFVIIAIIIIILNLIHIKRCCIALSREIKSIQPYSSVKKEKCYKGKISNDKFTVFIDIPTDLNNTFTTNFISASQEEDFINYYYLYFQKAHLLLKKAKIFHFTLPSILSKFLKDFDNINSNIKRHNDSIIRFILNENKYFFDHCLKYPLDTQQRRSIVSEEDNCLVVSSAGSGKTSSIVGKVKYLTKIKGISPNKILLISYTNKAAAELTERIDKRGLKGYTFHKLALDIIAKTTGFKPSICENTDSVFIAIYHNLLKSDDFKKNVVDYFFNYKVNEEDWEKRKNERRKNLSEQKHLRLKALFPDMDGNTVCVKSEQEYKICSALSILGVKYRYEEPYEHQLSDERHSQYCPDFSIYFDKDGKTKRVYLEHFGIDEHNLVPTWFAKDKNMTYEAANQKYNDGITWKKEAHKKFGTQLLTTSSADFHYYEIKDKLKDILKTAGVPIHEKSEKELYSLVFPKGSKQEKAFIRLIVTFVTLLKSNCKSIDEILGQAINVKDQRSVFIIDKIFKPIYEQYTQALNSDKKIDFTDAIIEATKICNTLHPIEYDYIIVDEFQDISIDRYNFLKSLRNGTKPAKLYCVGDDWQSIYRFSGSDMAIFNNFANYFGKTEINKIETTYRFGEPLVSLSTTFIQRNKLQIQKNIHPFSTDIKTELEFCPYDRRDYCNIIGKLISSIPKNKSIFLLGRYSFDDYYLSFMYKGIKEGNRFYYLIGSRKIEFLTIHKSKGLEADYVLLLQCNKDTYGFPSLVSDDPVLNYVLTESDKLPYGEERRLFYVAMTRAKIKTIVLYDKRFPSVFVNELLHPEQYSEINYIKHPNANKKWTRAADKFLITLYNEGKSVKYISAKMGRSQTSIVMRLNKLIP